MADLTETERSVLEARGEGESLKAIASRMGIGVGTVSGYQNRAIYKLIGPSRAHGARRLRLALREWERRLREDAVRIATGDIKDGMIGAPRTP